MIVRAGTDIGRYTAQPMLIDVCGPTSMYVGLLAFLLFTYLTLYLTIFLLSIYIIV